MKTLEFSVSPSLSPIINGEVWELSEHWHIVLCGRCVTIPKGFLTDGASIPRILWRVCGHPMSTKRISVAVVHDAIYSGELKGYTRKEADTIYRDALIEQGWPKWKAYLEYFTLRACGASHWSKID